MIDQAFQNMPYLISLNKKHIPFPSNFQLPFLQQNMALFQKITNLQSEFSNDQSIIAENKSIQASKLGGASFLRFPPNAKTTESIEKMDSNTARKMNILDELNKDIIDDFQEELVESKQDIPTPTQKNPESEFLFEEQILENEFKALIPDLNEEQVKTVENFRDLIDTGGKFNDKLYEFNEALFNKDEARIQRYKTHKVMMKALEHEMNKMEKHATKAEKEIIQGGEKLNEINKNMDIINNDLRKLIYEREADALIRKVDQTLANPLQLSDVFKTKQESGQKLNPQLYESKLIRIFKENQEVFNEIDQCMGRLGFDHENDEFSEIASQNLSESRLRNAYNYTSCNQTINESMTRKMIEKAQTLEKELRLHRNKKLVSVIENAPTQRNKSGNKTNQSLQKNSKVKKTGKKVENDKPTKPKKGGIKFRAI